MADQVAAHKRPPRPYGKRDEPWVSFDDHQSIAADNRIRRSTCPTPNPPTPHKPPRVCSHTSRNIDIISIATSLCLPIHHMHHESIVNASNGPTLPSVAHPSRSGDFPRKDRERVGPRRGGGRHPSHFRRFRRAVLPRPTVQPFRSVVELASPRWLPWLAYLSAPLSYAIQPRPLDGRHLSAGPAGITGMRRRRM
jgi:hypothetical protein